jgi:hypothetical protein
MNIQKINFNNDLVDSEYLQNAILQYIDKTSFPKKLLLDKLKEKRKNANIEMNLLQRKLINLEKEKININRKIQTKKDNNKFKIIELKEKI